MRFLHERNFQLSSYNHALDVYLRSHTLLLQIVHIRDMTTLTENTVNVMFYLVYILNILKLF